MLAMKQQATFIETVDALPKHVALLRQNLRQEDYQEIIRLGISIEKAVWQSFKGSVWRKSIFIDGRMAAMFGAHGTLMGDCAIPWLLTTPEVYRVSPLRFTRIYQQNVQEMLKIFHRLENFVDSEYNAAIRMLDIVGFKIGEPEPLGYIGKMYCKFWMER